MLPLLHSAIVVSAGLAPDFHLLIDEPLNDKAPWREALYQGSPYHTESYHHVEEAVEEFVTEYRYLLHTPSSVPQPPGGWPLVVYVEGSIECGNYNKPAQESLGKLHKWGPVGLAQPLAEQVPGFKELAILTYQQPCNDNHPRTKVLLASIENVAGFLRIDRRRIYLTGFSVGACVVWSTLSRFAGVFAAVAPLSGSCGDPLRKNRDKKPGWRNPPPAR